MVSVVVPLAYVAFLVGSLVIFSKVYRKRQATNAVREPWFPVHTTRDIYVSLLSMDPPASRPILIAALIRRAMTDVARIMEVRQSKLALQTLLTKGQIGDDTWAHLLETEKELEAELMEVVGEANTFKQGWGQIIFAHASDMVQHEKQQKIYHAIEAEREKARAYYLSPTPAIKPPPILGIAAGNPKRRTLPSNLVNAHVPPSKPTTPIPPATTPKAKQIQPNPALTPDSTPLKPISPAKVAAVASGASTPSRSSIPATPSSSPPKPSASSSSFIPPKAAPLMQRNDTAISTASSAPTGDGSGDEDGNEEEGDGVEGVNKASTTIGGSVGSPNGSAGGNTGGKKTPKKTPKKKKGKKK